MSFIRQKRLLWRNLRAILTVRTSELPVASDVDDEIGIKEEWRGKQSVTKVLSSYMMLSERSVCGIWSIDESPMWPLSSGRKFCIPSTPLPVRSSTLRSLHLAVNHYWATSISRTVQNENSTDFVIKRFVMINFLQNIVKDKIRRVHPKVIMACIWSNQIILTLTATVVFLCVHRYLLFFSPLFPQVTCFCSLLFQTSSLWIYFLCRFSWRNPFHWIEFALVSFDHCRADFSCLFFSSVKGQCDEFDDNDSPSRSNGWNSPC